MTPRFSMPGTRRGRMIVGIALIVGGIFGFLPVVGFWMIPLGLFVLSQDSPTIRRWRREMTVALVPRWRRMKSRFARGDDLGDDRR